jgi:alpha-glucosidase
MGLCGQAFTGPDVAGFSGEASGELLARWTAMGAFLPLFRNHSALGTPSQEPYAYGEPYETICRRYIELRYRLLPYIYTATWQAAESGLPIVRPLAFSFPSDRRVASLDDEFLCGDALLVAPVLEQGAQTRGVYLPAGDWYDFWSGKCIMGPADLPVQAPLDALPLFVRAGSVVPMGPVMQHSEEFVPEKLELHVFAGAGANSLYEDDGRTHAYRNGDMRVTQFKLEEDNNSLALTRSVHGPYDPGYQDYDVLLRGLPVAPANNRSSSPTTVLVDGSPVDWEIDPDWGAPRFAAGLFTRLEVRFD